MQHTNRQNLWSCAEICAKVRSGEKYQEILDICGFGFFPARVKPQQSGIKWSPAHKANRNLQLNEQQHERCNALFHPLVEVSQVSDFIIDAFCLHVITKEQTANVVFLHFAALRQVSKNLVHAHFISTLTHVTDVSKELLSVVPCKHINASFSTQIRNSFMKL